MFGFYLMMAWILVLYFLSKTHYNNNKNWVNDDDQKLQGGIETTTFFVIIVHRLLKDADFQRDHLQFLYFSL